MSRRRREFFRVQRSIQHGTQGHAFTPRLEGLLPLTLWLSLSLAAKFLLLEAAVLGGGEEGKRESLTHQIPQALLSKCLWGPRPAARSTVHSREALSAELDSIPALPPAS